MSTSHYQADDRTQRGLPGLAGTWFALNFVLLILLEHPPPASRRNAYQPSYQILRLFPDDESTKRNSDRLRYRLLRPADESAPAPLLVFLHGSGQRGTDNRQQLKGLPSQMADPWSRRQFPCYLLAPQCPPHSSWINEVERLAQLIERIIEAHAVDRRRVYLTGTSMGGFGTWHLAARRPDLFAAVVPLCGGGDPRTASRLASVTIWAVHGSDDSVVPVQNSRDMVQAVREVGGNPRYTELQGVGHTCWPLAYGEAFGVVPWMFEQRRTRSEAGQAVIASPQAASSLTTRRSHE